MQPVQAADDPIGRAAAAVGAGEGEIAESFLRELAGGRSPHLQSYVRLDVWGAGEPERQGKQEPRKLLFSCLRASAVVRRHLQVRERELCDLPEGGGCDNSSPDRPSRLVNGDEDDEARG